MKLFNKHLLNILNSYQKRITKLVILIGISIIFSFIYFFIPDSEFEGINKFQELLRDELIKKQVQKKIKNDDNVENFEGYLIKYKDNIEINSNTIQEETEALQELDPLTEKELDIKTMETTKLIKENEFKKANYSYSQKFLDRLYFAFVTGTTLGYGDVYPISNRTKLLAILQLLITVSLILL